VPVRPPARFISKTVVRISVTFYFGILEDCRSNLVLSRDCYDLSKFVICAVCAAISVEVLDLL